MWDSHCHLADFAPEKLDTILQVAEKNGITGFVTSASKFADFEQNFAIAQKYENVFFTAGLHPLFLPQEEWIEIKDKLYTLIANYKKSGKLLAIGEIGLDFRQKLTQEEKQKQINFLQQQLQLAQEFNLPVVLHVVKAHAQTIQVLQQSKFKQGGLMHAFNSGINEANFYTQNGFKLGIGTGILRANSQKLLHKISQLKVEDMVLETDSPYMQITADQANQPANAQLVAQKLAQMFATLPKEVEQITSENTYKIFPTLQTYP